MFQFSNHVIGVWFLAWTDRNASGRCGDWFAIAQRTDDGVWELLYRFRWYSLDAPDADPFLDKDTKSFYRGTAPDKQKLLAGARELVGILRKGGGIITDDQFWVNGDADKAMAIFMKRPWAHCQPADPEDN